MMMKFSSISVLSAVMVLSSCASISNRGNIEDVVHGEKHDNPPYGSGHTVDYGKPTRHADMKVEQRILTPEIASALDVPNAVSLLAFDLDGNPIRFTNRSEQLTEEEAIFPLDTSQIGNIFTTTYVWFEGSHCAVITDNLGYSMVVCSGN